MTIKQAFEYLASECGIGMKNNLWSDESTNVPESGVKISILY